LDIFDIKLNSKEFNMVLSEILILFSNPFEKISSDFVYFFELMQEVILNLFI